MMTSRITPAHTSRLLQWIASTLFVIGVLVDVTCAQECGSQAGGARCQYGCCSVYGYCGTTNDYCGPGNCRSQCPSSNPNCGNQGSPCANGQCCSKYGYCGTTKDYCGQGNCASQCPTGGSPPSGSGSGVGSIVTSSLFNTIFPSRNSFYTYQAFIASANSFPSFGTSGSHTTNLREIAAYFAQVSHETSGLVYIREIDQSFNYCDSNDNQYPCAPGQSYYGRGPLQISWNYNYGPAGHAIGKNLLSNPDLVAQDATVSFEASLWFWQTPQSPIPSCHDVMIGAWTPSQADVNAGRLPGFGLTIDIINGGLECGPAPSNPDGAADRIQYYQSICSLLGVDPGSNLNCRNMQSF